MFKMNGVGVFEGGNAKGTPFEAPSRRRPKYVAFTSLKPVHREPLVMTAEKLSPADKRFLKRETKFALKKNPWTGRAEGILKFGPEKFKPFPGEIDFTPKRLLTYPGHPSPDIRPLGPYELPDYSSRHPSAAGLSWIGAAAAEEEAAKPTFWESLLKTGKEILPVAKKAYEEYRSGKKRPSAPAPAYVPPPPQPVFVQTTAPGMSGTTIALLVGGGILVLGVGAILLLRK